METKFLELGPTIVRIQQTLYGKEPSDVRLTMIDPPCNQETGYGLSFIPAEHIVISGLINLLTLANAINEFCKAHMDEKEGYKF